ncbi:hypothetical protein [Nocardia brasiliensis]|uniref:hypothetical protein n=1 Tax=Nocardia brasiliensis TaxID=37326 RepID=UPI003D92ED40
MHATTVAETGQECWPAMRENKTNSGLDPIPDKRSDSHAFALAITHSIAAPRNIIRPAFDSPG